MEELYLYFEEILFYFQFSEIKPFLLSQSISLNFTSQFLYFLYIYLGRRSFAAEVMHAQVSKEPAVIEQISHCGMEQREKAKPISAVAKAVKRSQTTPSRAGVPSASKRVAPCLIEIFAEGWEGRNETPWTAAKPTIQFVPLPPEEQQ